MCSISIIPTHWKVSTNDILQNWDWQVVPNYMLNEAKWCFLFHIVAGWLVDTLIFYLLEFKTFYILCQIFWKKYYWINTHFPKSRTVFFNFASTWLIYWFNSIFSSGGCSVLFLVISMARWFNVAWISCIQHALT